MIDARSVYRGFAQAQRTLQEFEQRHGIAVDVRSLAYANLWLRTPDTRFPLPDLRTWYREPGLWLPLSCAIAHVDHVGAQSSGGGAVTTGTMNSGSNGNLLVAVVSGYSGINPIGNVTDSKSNAGWTALTVSPDASTPGVTCQIWYCKNATCGSGHTATVGAASTFCTLNFAAFSGVDTTSPYDSGAGENGASNGAGASTVQPGSITTSTANLIITGVVLQTTAAVPTVSTGSYDTTGTSFDTSGGNAQGGGLSYKIQGSAGAENPTWTVAPGTSPMAAVIASFIASSGGGGRASKNIRSNPLGMALGMGLGMPGTGA